MLGCFDRKELILTADRLIRDNVGSDGMVSYERVRTVLDNILNDIMQEPKPIQKFIFVEDGTVDTDELTEMLVMSNPEIKVVVYRAGARPPELVEVK